MSVSAMKSLVNLFEMPVSNMGINLGCPDAFMAEHFLNGADIGTTYQQVRGKGMPQRMGCCLDRQAGSFCILGNNILDGPYRQSHLLAAFLNIHFTTMANK